MAYEDQMRGELGAMARRASASLETAASLDDTAVMQPAKTKQRTLRSQLDRRFQVGKNPAKSAAESASAFNFDSSPISNPRPTRNTSVMHEQAREEAITRVRSNMDTRKAAWEAEQRKTPLQRLADRRKGGTPRIATPSPAAAQKAVTKNVQEKVAKDALKWYDNPKFWKGAGKWGAVVGGGMIVMDQLNKRHGKSNNELYRR